MTSILLVRHGQASFGGGDYDLLSSLGEAQAAVVGDRLRADGRAPDAAWSGGLRRQADTARLALGEAAAAVAATVDDAFNEYSADALFARYAPDIAATDLRRDPKLFQTRLTAVMTAWLADAAPEATRDGVESWQSFRARIRAGLAAAVRDRGKEETIAVFTSGGVIGAAVGEALNLSPRRAVALSWRVLNASITELHFGRSGFSLVGFNDAAHLRRVGPHYLTHR